MALNFPDSPTLNQVYTDITSGFSYKWNGTVWISFEASSPNSIRELDDISGSFNGVANTFPLTIGGASVSPASTSQLIISVANVILNPTNDYNISGSNIVFTAAPTGGSQFFGTLLGSALPVGVSTVGDVYRQQSYTATASQTVFTFGAGYTPGFLEVYRNGVRLVSGDDFTASNGTSFTLTTPAAAGDAIEAVGYITSSIATLDGNLTSLLVNNNARILGVTTVGTNVGVGQTALNVQGNVRVTGVVTATSFVGDGTGLTGVSAGISTSKSVGMLMVFGY